MRIAVYSKPFFPQMGGLERNTLTLCSALTDLGHEICLITETASTEEKSYSFPVVRTRSPYRIYDQLGGTDLLITNGGNVPLWAVVPAVARGLPYGMIYHGFRGFENEEYGVVNRLKNELRKSLAQKARVNVFTSTHSKEITNVPEERAHVLLNPVDKRMMELYKEGTERGGSNKDAPFLFAGRLIEGKGILLLAEALKRLDGDQEFELIVAGEGRDEERFRSHVVKLETITVDIAGRLEADELIPLYQRAKALLVPTTTHLEGNPLVIAEALYAGTPVIASDQPPMIESVADAGIIVEQGDAAALASAIARANSDESYYQSLREAALDRGDMFGYDRYKNRVRNIMKNVT
ncbi:glycosyltransferase family 4 protein [Salinibacter ruber]|uniref:glycosyltransferase family 4 protein n=1 Tax=Salinibacter ruber TaxID=146919 RepID=UPI00216AB10E|nr:glycosyltransferase family 4 protein [Salinibacter ruber]MCS4199751.1 glycosyltransferase involved in cell wall biosynthesis [Salinibacter ruber]